MDIDQDIKLYIFDFDGTLFNLGIDWAELRTKIESEIGVSNLSLSDLKAVLPKRKYLIAYNIIDEYENKGVENGNIIEGAVEVINELRKKYIVAIVSRNHKATIQNALTRFGVEVDEVLGEESVSVHKPNPEGIKYAMDMFGCSPRQTVMIGDTSHDVHAAKDAGIQSIVLVNKKLRQVPTGADLYIESLKDLLR